jgi:tetratricopeptide (TPR) repeat protein
MTYAAKQQYEQALTEEKRAITLDPNYANSYIRQVEALDFAGRPEEALRAVAQAMRLNPRYPPWYLLELGWSYRLAGQYAEAIAALQDALSQNPNMIGAYLHIALSYLSQWLAQQSPAGQTLEPAMAAIQRALALNDSFFAGHVISGYISLSQQRYEQALAEMERSVALGPTEAGSYVALAQVLSCVGRMEEALAAAAQAQQLKFYGAVDEHLAVVGGVYALAGHFEEARALLQRFLSHYPNHLSPHLTLASVYSQLGQEAEARAEAAEVLRINPQFSLEIHRQRSPIKDPAVLERQIAALRKAGLT